MAKIDTKKLSLIAMLASVYAALSFLPGMPMIGAEGSTIDLVRMLEIGYGLVLGPVYGPAAAFLGAIVGKATQRRWFRNVFHTTCSCFSIHSSHAWKR